MLHPFPESKWDERFSEANQHLATDSLEHGQVLYFPQLAFVLLPEETQFLSPDYADPRSKNIGYHPDLNKLWGVQRLIDDERIKLKMMIHRFYQASRKLVEQLLPRYAGPLINGRTSFRPVQINDRQTSSRKDDKRLHIDAFPSAPNQGKRILRVFCNVNPHGESRIWRLGEPFEKVAQRFVPQIKKPFPGQAALLRLFKITKSYRSLYDHYMLHIHDSMKADEQYQQEVNYQTVHFPAGSTWIVQTDDVSHAAMQGQYVLEQTFYLPVSAMQNEALAPVRVLERLVGEELV